MLFTKYEVVYVEYTCVVLAVHCASGAGAAGSVYCMCRRATVCLGVRRGGVMVSACMGVGR